MSGDSTMRRGRRCAVVLAVAAVATAVCVYDATAGEVRADSKGSVPAVEDASSGMEAPSVVVEGPVRCRLLPFEHETRSGDASSGPGPGGDRDDGDPCYQIDDGAIEASIGWAAPQPFPKDHVTWVVQYTVEEGCETLSHVVVGWGDVAPGTPNPTTEYGEILIYLDTDGDGIPYGAELVYAETVQVPDASYGPVYVEYALSHPISIGEVGDSFFVGAHFEHSVDWQWPVGYDTSPGDHPGRSGLWRYSSRWV